MKTETQPNESLCLCVSTHADWFMRFLPTYGGIKIQYFNLAILSWTENCANLNGFWLHQLLLSFSQPNAPLTKWLQAWIHSDCNERSSEQEKISSLQFRLGRPFKVSNVKRYGWSASFDRPLVGEEEEPKGEKDGQGKNFGSLNVLMSINKTPKKRPITNLITQLELRVMNKPFLSWGCVYQIS